jgi:hypothetical protein
VGGERGAAAADVPPAVAHHLELGVEVGVHAGMQAGIHLGLGTQQKGGKAQKQERLRGGRAVMRQEDGVERRQMHRAPEYVTRTPVAGLTLANVAWSERLDATSRGPASDEPPS